MKSRILSLALGPSRSETVDLRAWTRAISWLILVGERMLAYLNAHPHLADSFLRRHVGRHALPVDELLLTLVGGADKAIVVAIP